MITAGLLATACSAISASPDASGGQVVAVGAENEYANVIGQIGGNYVQVTAIESNPNTDPHTFEASPAWRRSSVAPSSWSRTASATTPT